MGPYRAALSVVCALFGVALLTVGVTAHASSGWARHPNGVNAKGTTLDEADTISPYPNRHSKPLYPNDPRMDGKQGCVVVSFNVNPTGKPVNVRILKSEPAGVFDQVGLKTVKGWRFRVTKNGKPAWMYNIFQEIDFRLSSMNMRPFIAAHWLCGQPLSSAILVRPERGQTGKLTLMASYLSERVLYLPVRRGQSLSDGSATVKFCIEANGSMVQPQIEKTSGYARYGVLAVEDLRSMHFRPLFIDGHGKRVCGIARKVYFVTKRAQHFDPPVICGCQKHPLEIFRLGSPGAVVSGTTKAAITTLRYGGDARMKICLSASGKVTKATFLREGSTSLDSAVMQALGDFRFFAQRDDSGRAVKSCGWQIWAHGKSLTASN